MGADSNADPRATRTTSAVPVAAATAGTAPAPARDPRSLERDLGGRPPSGPWRLALRRLRRAKLALAGLAVIGVLTLLAIFAGPVAPYGENEVDLFSITAPPSSAHWLGTDELGRDELSRLLFGGRISLLVGVAAALLSTALGIVVGALAAYYGGWVDALLMRFVDLMLAFPAIFLLLIVFALRGGSVLSVVLFLGGFGWMWLARIIRGEFLSLKQREFVEAARSLGVGDGRLIVRHLLPNVVAAIVVSATLNVAFDMLAESTLSFLGFGVPPAPRPGATCSTPPAPTTPPIPSWRSPPG